MQVMWQRGVGLACIASLVLAIVPAGDSTHEAPAMAVVISPADLGLRISNQEQVLRLDVTNPHATETAERLTFTAPAPEHIAFVGATAAGWTATASDTGSDGNDDQLVMTGTLAAGATVDVQITLRVLATEETDPQEPLQVITVTLESTTPTPAATLGTETIHDLTFHNSRITANPSIVLLEEGGSADTIQVRLTEDPGLDEDSNPVTVTVQVATTDASLATADPPTLTFTGDPDPDAPGAQPGSWNTPQAVTITPTAGDSVDGGTQEVRLNLRYGEEPLAAGLSMPVFIADDDEAGIVLIEQPEGQPTIVYEGSDTDTIGVRLATQPTAQVDLSLTISSTGQATLDKSTLTFDGSNWQTPQQVTITAVDDAVAEALVTTTQINVAVTGTAARDDGYDDVEVQSLTLSVVDDEGTDVIVEQSEGFTLVAEALGESDTFTVVLARQPLADVTVDIKLGAASSDDLSVLPPAITFTPSNWLIPKQVVIKVVDDELGEGTEIASVDVVVNEASSPEYTKIAKKTVSATIVDDEIRGFVPVITSPNEATSESGTAATHVTVDVTLSVPPDADVGLTVTSSDTGEIAVQSGSTLRFTPDNWDTPQSVVLRGVDDDLHDGHQDVNISFAPTADSHPLWRDLQAINLTVVNRDDERTVMLRPMALFLDEGNASSYELSLTRPPASGQTVKVLIAPAEGLAVEAATAQSTSSETGRIILSFSAADTPQIVRVTAVDDDIARGDRALAITHTATSGDSAYHGVPVADLVVNVTDDERFDVAAANRALQQTVEVTRRGGDNRVSWDIDVVAGEAAGVQIWRSSSPFAIIATLHEDGPEYRDGEYRDRGGRAADHYIVTVFYGPTSAEGRFAPTTQLSLVPGYLGLSLAEQQALAQAAPDGGGLSTGAWVAIIVVGAVLLIGLVILIAVAARKKEPEDEVPDEPEAWQPAEAAPATDEQTYHLTCPRCANDFDAVGHKPLVTHCPHCGVEGVLR